MTDASVATAPQSTRGLDWPDRGSSFDAHSLRVEEIEEDDCFVIRAELPGIASEADLDLRIRGHALEIRARRQQMTSTKHKGTRHSEFRYGLFWRVLTLPHGARESETAATYENGILEVRVPVGDAGTAGEICIPITRR